MGRKLTVIQISTVKKRCWITFFLKGDLFHFLNRRNGMETTGVIPNSIVTDPFIACHFGERHGSLGENLFNSERTLTDMSVGATVESTPRDLSTALVAVGQGQDRKSFHRLFEHFAPRL